MKFTIKLFGIFFTLAGILFLIDPEVIYTWLDNNGEKTWLYIFAIVFRLVLGILFIIAAGESKYPTAIRVFGFLITVAAIILIFIGQKTFQEMMSSLIPLFKPYALVSGLIAMAFGGFLIYAFI